MAYSFSTSVGDAVTTVFAFTFTGLDKGYLNKSDVHVELVDEQGVWTEVPYNTGWIFETTNSIRFLQTAPPVNTVFPHNIRIRRIMDKSSPYADWSVGQNFDEQTLDNSFLKLLYIEHELLDGFGMLDATGNINMHGYRITDMAKAIDDNDAVTLKQVYELLEVFDAQGVVPIEQPRQTITSGVTQYNTPATKKASPSSFFVFVDTLRQKPNVDYTTNTIGKIDLIGTYPSGAILDIVYFEPRTLDTQTVRVIDNVAAFSTNTFVVGEIVETKGFYTDGDGGGAKYLIVSGSTGDGSGNHTVGNNTAKLLHNGSVSIRQLGVKHGDGIATMSQIEGAIKYMQRGQWIDPTATYTDAQLSSIADEISKQTGAPDELVVDALVSHSDTLHIAGGFSIKTYNTKGAYGNTVESYGFFYSGTGEVGITTAFKKVGQDWKSITTFADCTSIYNLASRDLVRDNTKTVTDKITWETAFGCRNNTSIGVILYATNSEFNSCNFGMTNAKADTAAVFIETWDCTFNSCNCHGLNQSAVYISVNSSCSVRDQYNTVATAKTASTDTFHPSTYTTIADYDTEVLTVLLRFSDVTFYNIKTESNGISHSITADTECKISIFGGYFETHNPTWGFRTAISLYDNSQCTLEGGFLPQSHQSGFVIYAERIDANRPSSFNSILNGDGGFLIKTVSCSAYMDIGLRNNGAYGGWGGRYLTDGTGTTDLDRINLTGISLDEITLAPSGTLIGYAECFTMEQAVKLCRMTNATSIKLIGDLTLSNSVDIGNAIPSRRLKIYSTNNYKIHTGTHTLGLLSLTDVYFEGIAFSSTTTGQSYHIVKAGNTFVSFKSCIFIGSFALLGFTVTAPYAARASCDILSCDFNNWTGKYATASTLPYGSPSDLLIATTNTATVGVTNMPNAVIRILQ